MVPILEERVKTRDFIFTRELCVMGVATAPQAMVFERIPYFEYAMGIWARQSDRRKG